MLKSLMTKLSLIAFACSMSFAVYAMADTPKPIDVPAGDLVPALESLAKQAAVELVFQSAQLNGIRTQGVRGTYEVKDAMRLLLKGTGLELRTDPSGAMLIAPPRPKGQADASPGARESRRATSNAQRAGDVLRLAQSDQGQTAQYSQTPAQEPPLLAQIVVKLPEILVKGSRVTNVDVTRTADDTQAYYILDSQQLAQSGAVNLEDFLKQRLSMDTTAQSNSQKWGQVFGGTSSISLRGLGANETLILIDGRRTANVTIGGNSYQPDINGIPLSAIERIEVLPSSASAIYGGAAVGGVVNIILKKNYQGGELGAVYEDTFQAHAPLHTLAGTYGLSFEGGETHLMVSGQYSDGQSLQLRDRPSVVGRGISEVLDNSPSFFTQILTGPFAGATTNIRSSAGNLVLKDGAPLSSMITYVPVGAGPGSNISAGLLANAGSYNLSLAPGTGEYGLFNQIGNVPRIKSFMASARREMTPFLDVFTEFSTQSNATHALDNPFSQGYSVPATAPDNPFRQAVSVNFPSALFTATRTNSVMHSVTVGAVGRLPGGWTAELDYTWSGNHMAYDFYNVDNTAFSAALANGTVNPFVDPVANPLALTPYLAPTFYSARSSLNDLGLRASGSIPWPIASVQPSLTIGLEHRKEGNQNSDFYSVDPLTPSNTSHYLYFGHSQSTNSIYGELQLPFISPRSAIVGIHSLDVQLAGRREDYVVDVGTPYDYLSPPSLQPFNPPQNVHSTVKYTSSNPTIGIKYSPAASITLRGSYSRAFLPPTYAQLLTNPTPLSSAGFVITDPDNGRTYTVREITGGNASLLPQTSKDWDLGVILEPQDPLLKGLRLDIEHYEVTQPDYITTPTAQQIVSNPAYQGRVTRDSTTGLISVVDISLVNAEMYKAEGWNFTVDYRKASPAGTFDLSALATLVEHDRRQYTIGGALLDYVGFPSEGGEAKFKGNAMLRWERGHWSIGWTTTYYGGYRQYGSPGGPYALQHSVPQTIFTQAQGGYSIASQVYHDVSVRFAFDGLASRGAAGHVLSGLLIQAGVKNVFNSVPPFDPYYYPYFYSPYGDPRLRDFFVSIKKEF